MSIMIYLAAAVKALFKRRGEIFFGPSRPICRRVLPISQS